MAEPDNANIRELELQYRNFLDDEGTDGVYKAKVEDMIKREETRLIVKINDTRRNPNFRDRAQALIENSSEELVAFQRALKEYVIALDPAYGRKVFEFHIGLCGSFGSSHVTPRTLNARHLNNTVCVEGIVSKISLIKPKLVKSVLYCHATKKVTERRHYDLSSLDFHPSLNVLETKDENGNPLDLEYGRCIYKDHQMVTLQEMPESAPPGQLPRCVDLILEWDLVDKCKPGDRVQIVGTYRCLPNKQGNYSNCIFRAVILANYVEQMSKEVSMTVTDDDVKACKRLSRLRRINIFEQLACSLAPTIHGHEHVKRAILCQLLGGVEKILPNGTRLRGDINILLIGDPSVAKSQLLRFVLNIAPRAIATTGRGSTGVGLTAAVTTDPDTGDRRLEAGAMVLADRGVVCVDEFDKMSDIDRTAIHEVMEQGRVTICKAGIQASLNARCSVLAAANPVCGNYDPYKLPMDNIGLQDSLLSRFDLLFVMLDEHDRKNDKRISDHVVRIHRYRPSDELDGEPTPLNENTNHLSTVNEDADDFTKTEIFEKHDPLLHGNRGPRDRFFTIEFLRKYIHIAKRVKPQLTEEACFMIGSHYSDLRNHDRGVDDLAKTLPITARTLETLIRLSTAHAKARLSTKVESQDAAAAIDLIELSVYRKVLTRPAKKKRTVDESLFPLSGDGDRDGDSDVEASEAQQPGQNKRVRRDSEQEHDDQEMELDQDGLDKLETLPEGCVEDPEAVVSGLSEEQKANYLSKMNEFKKFVNQMSRESNFATALDIDRLAQEAKNRLDYDRKDLNIMLLLLSAQDRGTIDGNTFYLID